MQRQLLLLILLLIALIISAASAHADPRTQAEPDGSRIMIDAVVLEEANNAHDAEQPTLQVIFTVLDQAGNPIQSPLIDNVQITLDGAERRDPSSARPGSHADVYCRVDGCQRQYER